LASWGELKKTKIYPKRIFDKKSHAGAIRLSRSRIEGRANRLELISVKGGESDDINQRLKTK
jgi:hypothetical protein